MLISKLQLKNIILEELNKEVNDQKIQSLANSLASELKNLSQELKSDAADSNVDGTKDVKEGGTILAISIAAALPKILELAAEYATKFKFIDINVSVGLGMLAQDLHHIYIGVLTNILKLIPSYRRAPKDVQKEIADTVFIVIVAMLIPASAHALLATITQLSLSVKIPIEIALLKIKSGEIKEYLVDYTQNELKHYKT